MHEYNAGCLLLKKCLAGVKGVDVTVFTNGWPKDPHALDGAVLATESFVLRFFGNNGDDRLVFVNYGPDIHRSSFAEPLIAPPEGRKWRLLWSSEEPKYGGSGVAPFEDEKGWHLTGHSALALCPEAR